MIPEFSRSFAVETIPTEGRTVSVEADAEERRKLAARFGWIAIERLEAEAMLTPLAGAVGVTGRLRAAIVQPCVASGEPIPAQIDEPFALRFVESELLASGEDEVELGEADLDVIDYEGGAIDLGEAVAQTLALAADPFPRSPDAAAKLKAAGVLGEDEAGPFAGLKGLLKS